MVLGCGDNAAPPRAAARTTSAVDEDPGTWFAWYPARARLVLDRSVPFPTSAWDGAPAARWVWLERVMIVGAPEAPRYELRARPETPDELIDRQW